MKMIDFASGHQWIKYAWRPEVYVAVDGSLIDPETGTKQTADILLDLNKPFTTRYRPGYFDVVVAQCIFEHLTNIYPLIDEIKRLDAERIILAVPNALAYDNRFYMLFGKNQDYGLAFKDILHHHTYFDFPAFNAFCERFFPDYTIIRKTYRCFGRFGTFFRHLVMLRPTLFCTEIEYELKKTSKLEPEDLPCKITKNEGYYRRIHDSELQARGLM